jgi:hypothetical protein
MSDTPDRTLAILYEHPEWFRPLFAELDRRGLPYRKLNAAEHDYTPSANGDGREVLFNRMSPSAHLRGGGDAVFYTRHYLEHLERVGTRVVNGSGAYGIEISKAAQLSLLHWLGLGYPAARVIHRAEQAPAAARGLRFPVVVKPNVGGSGAGIVRFDSLEQLQAAAHDGSLGLGLDSTALVQEYIAPEGGRIIRVEVVGGRFLYAIRVYTSGETFDLCPADVCQSTDGQALAGACATDAAKAGLQVEGFEPPPEVIASVERIMEAAGIEVGGVEYLIDPRDGRPRYYDVNALSNFVADPERVIGFDPHVRLVDWLVEEVL